MAITLTMDVALTMLMSWLPVGGTMERIACGITILRRTRLRVMPKARAVSIWRESTEIRPARMISAM